MDFLILGPLDVRDERGRLRLDAAKLRLLLALLLLRANEVVPADHLADALWGERQPAGAANTLQVYVGRVRKALGGGRLRTRPPGYLLDVRPGELDLERFELLAAEGREALAGDDPGRAAKRLRDALALWRGAALADLAYEDALRIEIERLEEARLVALEDRVMADLALGHDADLVPELEGVVREHPLREQPRSQLMLALYRAGRQADALAVYRDTRRTLDEELGLEPGPDLQELQRAMLNHDPALTAAPPPRASLPTGTVTLLFTDIEGSTRLLECIGDHYSSLLEQHRRILREAVEMHDGREVDATGDAFLAAFSAAKDAVRAAGEAQLALSGHAWEAEGAEVRVRMGIHSGEPARAGDSYVGVDVHRGARICAAAHGGQVLISQTTHDLLEDEQIAGLTFLDLGEHRLKDLTRPQRLFQAVVAGLPTDFPPLLSVAPAALPVQPTPLIGRESEIDAVSSLLTRDRARLVTLTGAGGSGKTRLGLQIAADLAERFNDGVVFVGLAAIDDAALVPSELAQALSLRQAPEESLRNVLIAHLRERELLLVLDNLEQLPGVAPLVADIVAEAPGVVVLGTSRAPLHLSAEHEFVVPPLPVPPRDLDLDELARYDSIALFVERGGRVDRRFDLTPANAPAVAEICRCLDGLPLAIELAAARVKVLPPADILRMLQRGVDLTGGARDAPARQRTLHATIDWSYQLLEEHERLLFARLSVFAGGWTLAGAEAVCEQQVDVLETLSSLLDKSLVDRADAVGDGRFRMLRTIRVYGLDRLRDSGEENVIRRLHAEWALATVAEADAQLTGPDQAAHLAVIGEEHENVRTALAWALESDAPLALRLATTLQRFWYLQGHAAEGLRSLEQALVAAGEQPSLLRARALRAAGTLAESLGAYEQARALLEESVDLLTSPSDSEELAISLNNLGAVALQQGDYAASRGSFERSLAIKRDFDDRLGIALTLGNLAVLEFKHGEFDSARALHEEALVIMRRLGHSSGIANSLANLGELSLVEDDLVVAERHLRKSLAMCRELGHRAGVAEALVLLARAAHEGGNPEESVRLLEEALEISCEIEDKGGIASTLEAVGDLAAVMGDAPRALALRGAAEGVRESISAPMWESDRIWESRTLARVRPMLGAAKEAEHLERGRRLSLEQAVELASAHLPV
jgi:predicted ATPase/class 3 adenylate cyclase